MIDAVGEMDLEKFYGGYRADGRSRPPYDPAMMVALLLYECVRGIRLLARDRARLRGGRRLAGAGGPAAAGPCDVGAVRRAPPGGDSGLFGEVLTLCRGCLG